jgi:hypothetical protein
MLGQLIREQDVQRTAWRSRDTVGNEPAVARRQVRTADASVPAALESCTQVFQPVWIRTRIRVDIRDDLASGREQASVARAGKPAILRADYPDVVASGNGSTAVGRSIIDDDNFVAWVIQTLQPVRQKSRVSLPLYTQTMTEISGAVWDTATGAFVNSCRTTCSAGFDAPVRSISPKSQSSTS